MPFPRRAFRWTAGALAVYLGLEAYYHIRTKRIVFARELEPEPELRYRLASVHGTYVNPFAEYRPQTGFEYAFVRILEVFERFYGEKIEVHEAEVDEQLRTHRPDLELWRKNTEKPSGKLLFTWLGQLCSLISVGGLNILTDPIFGDHLISEHFGPKRLLPSPMSLADVRYATKNKLDLVLVSHNHPDHLELPVVREIGNSALWVVPLGLGSVLAKEGVLRYVEMDWWESKPLGLPGPKGFSGSESLAENLPGKPGQSGFELVCLPAMHWLGRKVYDSNTLLWALFLLRQNGRSLVYHAGDTGYLEGLFGAIASKFGPVALSVLPIGQYCPEWHQRPRHISPAESMKIAEAVRSKYVFGVHFGTFKLSAEPILEPKKKFLALAKARAVYPEYDVPEFGKTYILDID